MYTLANMLTIIQNAQAVGHETVTVPYSRMNFDIVTILKENGFVSDVEKKKIKGKKSELPVIGITLKYENAKGVILGTKLISKPSRRMYAGKRDLHQVRNGYGISVISTPKGIMTGEEAKKANVGGEVLFEIW